MKSVVKIIGLLYLLIQSVEAAVLYEGIWPYEIKNGEAYLVNPGREDGRTYYKTSMRGNIQFPTTLGGCPLVEIGDQFLSGCSDVTNVVIPSTVRRIGEYAFSDTRIKSICLPKCLNEIGDGAFSLCNQILSITIPDNVSYLGWGTLLLCEQMQYVYIGSSVSNVNYTCFQGCPSSLTIEVSKDNPYYYEGLFYSLDQKTVIATLRPNIGKQIQIKEGVTHIADYAFCQAKYLENITFPNSLVSIGDYGFSSCPNLQSIRFGENVRDFGERAFAGCCSLKEVSLPNSVTNMSDYLFSQCDSLQKLHIGKSVESLGWCALWLCDSLSNLTVDVSNKKFVAVDNVLYSKDLKTLHVCPGGVENCNILDSVIDIKSEAFHNSAHLKRVSIPDSVEKLRQRQFYECYELEEVELGSGIVSIDYCTFEGCTMLNKIVIPKNVTSIDHYAFKGCVGLQYVIFLGDAPYWDSNVLDGVDADCFPTAIVVEGSKGWGCDIPGRWNGMAIEYCGHINVNYEGGVSPTCDQVGMTGEGSCQTCQKYLENSTIPALGHVEVETKAAKSATCTEDGCTKEVSCSRCNAVLVASNVLPKLGHIEVETKAAKAATCTEDGCTKEVSCSRCKAVLVASTVVPKLGHAEIETKTAKSATCTEDGRTKEVSCSRCKHVLVSSSVLSKLGHSQKTTITPIAPTCTEDGRTAEIVCGRCNQKLQASQMLQSYGGHSGAITKHAVAPTSSNPGQTAEITCTRCAQVLQEQKEIPALGYIRNVTARQIWPHKKIEITYELAEDIGDVLTEDTELAVKIDGVSISAIAQTLLGDMSLTPGLHRVVWDMEADGVEMKDASAVAEVSFGKNIPGFVTKTFSLAFDKTSDVWSNTPQIVATPNMIYISPASLAEYTTVAYGCYMYMEGGVTYYFKGRYDDYVGVKVGSSWIMSNSTECNEASGSYTPSATGYYRVEFRVGNNTGPGGLNDSNQYGIKWRTSKNTTWRNIGNTSSETVFFASITESGSQEVCGVSSEFEVDTKSLTNGMAVEGMLSLGYSPFADGTVNVEIDGAKVFSSTNSGVFVWQPQTTGTHTLKHLSGSYEWTRTVNVTSLAFEFAPTPNPPTEADANVAIGSTMRAFSQAGGTGAITTSGSGTLAVTASVEWITISSASSAGRPVAYKVAENNSAESRTGYIYISGHVFTVTQEGVGGALDIYSAEFETDGGRGVFGVIVDAGVTWKAQSNVDWISVDSTVGTGEGEVAFTVAPWDEVSTRVGTITAAGNTFTVTQTGRRMKLSKNVIEYDYLSHAIDVQVNALSTTSWDVELGASWISIVDGGRGNGSDDVFLAINENPSYVPRQGVVRIGTEKLLITQTGRPTEALDFSISPEEATASVDGANAVLAVTATPDLPWEAKSESAWLTIMPSFKSGTGNGNVIYTASPNPTMASRTGRITVSPASETGVLALTHTVTQAAATALISADEHTFDAAGSSFDVEVTVADVVNWSIVKDSSSWVTISGSLSRIGPDTVTIAAQENLTTENREATVTIAGHTFTVRQPGRRVNVEYEAKVFGTADDYGTIEVQPDGNVTWKAVISENALDWLVIWGDNCDCDDDGNLIGVGEQTIEYMVTEYNGDGTPRTGTITIGDKVIYVTQRAYDLAIEPSAVWVSGNAGAGSVSVPASIGEVWNAIATEPWITVVNGTGSGSGSGTVQYTFTENNTGEVRAGRIIIAGEEYTITQAARQMVTIGVSTSVITANGESVPGGGIVSGAGVYERGTQVTLTAIANDGYTFIGWTVAGSSAGNASTLTFVADIDKEVVAIFKRISVYLVNGEVVREGTTKTFTAPEAILDELGTTKVVCKGSSRFPEKGASFPLVITEDVSFEWDLWETNYFVSVQQPVGGVIRENGAIFTGRWVKSGEELALTAHPNNGQSFFRWQLSPLDAATVLSTSASLRFPVRRPQIVSAEFGIFSDTLAAALDASELVFTTGGDAEWLPVVDATAEAGYSSAQSGVIGKESETWLETTVSGTGELSFRWKVDCEKDDGGEVTWDRLSVFVNGVETARIDGKTSWQRLTLPVSGGKTTIRWSFYRDDYDEANADCQNKAWVDDIKFTAKEGK